MTPRNSERMLPPSPRPKVTGREHNAFQPVRDAINKLSSQARREMIALMQIGRGDGVGWVSSFPHLVEQAESEHAADYVVGKGRLLAKYLRDGLRKLGLGEVETSRC